MRARGQSCRPSPPASDAGRTRPRLRAVLPRPRADRAPVPPRPMRRYGGAGRAARSCPARYGAPRGRGGELSGARCGGGRGGPADPVRGCAGSRRGTHVRGTGPRSLWRRRCDRAKTMLTGVRRTQVRPGEHERLRVGVRLSAVLVGVLCGEQGYVRKASVVSGHASGSVRQPCVTPGTPGDSSTIPPCAPSPPRTASVREERDREHHVIASTAGPRARPRATEYGEQNDHHERPSDPSTTHRPFRVPIVPRTAPFHARAAAPRTEAGRAP